MSEELKPCPFCGGEVEEDYTSVSEYSGHDWQYGSIECKSCKMSFDMEIFYPGCACCADKGKIMRDAWNKRV